MLCWCSENLFLKAQMWRRVKVETRGNMFRGADGAGALRAFFSRKSTGYGRMSLWYGLIEVVLENHSK